MSRGATLRKVGIAAALGGGGLTALSGLSYAVLAAEARFARWMIGEISSPVPDATGWYGGSRGGDVVRIALLGDSSAAGYGVETVEETPGAALAASISEQSGRRVYLREVCKVGATSLDLSGQVTRALNLRPHVAVILIGANDVTHTISPRSSVRALREAVRRLRAVGTEVIVGTCPDLGTVRPIPQPLRTVARVWSRRLASDQSAGTLAEGGRPILLGSLLGPEFDASPSVLFGPDRFHPSAAGYAAMVRAVTPSVLAAIGVETADHVQQATMTLDQAVEAAVERPGTELRAEPGRRGLVRVVFRRRTPLAAPEQPQEEQPLGA